MHADLTSRPTLLSMALAMALLSTLVVAQTAAGDATKQADPLAPADDADRARVRAEFFDLDQSNLHSCISAAKRLIAIGTPFALKRSMEAIQMRGPNQEVKMNIAKGLAGKLGPKNDDAREALFALFMRTLMKESSTEVQEPLVRALGTYPDKAVALERLLAYYPRGDNDEVRLAVIEVSGGLAPHVEETLQKKSIKFFRKQAKSLYALPRRAAIFALFDLTPEDAERQAVRMLLKDDYNDNRIAAGKKLHAAGKEDHTDDYCRVMMKDPSWYVRDAMLQIVKTSPSNVKVRTLCSMMINEPKEDIRLQIPPIFTKWKGGKWDAQMLGALKKRNAKERNTDVMRRIRQAIGGW